jgi:predicted amidohydrolase YtcJ
MKNWVCMFVLLGFFMTVKAQQKVDCILYNAHIISYQTMSEQAQEMAIHQGRIIALGATKEIQKLYVTSNKINFKGQFIYPSWTDAHGHFMGLGLVAMQPNLKNAQSIQDIVELCLKAQKANHLKVIKAWGWNQENFNNKQMPTHALLNQTFPQIPVFLKRVDGHAALVNEVALQFAGISDTTVRFGDLVQKVNGKLTGVLFDAAANAVEQSLENTDTETKISALLLAQKICFENGIAMVHDAGIDLPTLKLIDSLQALDLLKIRINAMLYLTDTAFAFLNKHGAIHQNKLHVNGFKLVVDGALGSRGACLQKPYTDQANWYGTFLQAPSTINHWVQQVSKTSFQLSTHAIGDSANAFVLSSYQSNLRGSQNRRWRIEHAQVLDSTLFQYFNSTSILPSVQPIHAFSDHNWAPTRLGTNRIQYAYAYNKMISSAEKILIGTDFPVEHPHPLKNYWAALGHFDAQATQDTTHYLKAKQALLGMTSWPAYAAFLENDLGDLNPGKWADFVVYEENILQIPSQNLPLLNPISLFIAGQKVK